MELVRTQKNRTTKYFNILLIGSYVFGILVNTFVNVWVFETKITPLKEKVT